MKLTMILLMATLMQVSAAGYAQKITLSKKDESLIRVLKQIRQQSGYNFIYNQKSLKNAKNVSINIINADIEEALKLCFDGQPLTYEVLMNTVVIKELDKNKGSLADIKVSGKVTDSNGQPLPGVSVKIKGHSTGTITDISGNYEINIPERSTLTFSYIGYEAQEIEVNNRTTINVKLVEASTSLNEIVVTALGISRNKKSLTYSTQSVSTEELTQARELNVINSLQGKVAGLSLNSSGSGVGSAARVILRGNRSISGNSQPLYVIDGVPVRGNPADLNPDNIASINVLKGANAAALYGSAGQNGVIVIETKKGKQGVNIGLSTTYMLQEAVNSIPYQNIYGQGVSGLYIKTSESSWGPKMEGQMVDSWSLDPAQTGAKYPYQPHPETREGIFQTGHNSATNLSISTGGEKTQTLFTYTYTNAEGILPNNALLRHNINVRMTNNLSKRLILDSKLDYMRQNIDNRLDEGESSYNPMRQIYTMPSNIRSEDVSQFEYTDPTLGVTRQNYWNPGNITGANPYWTLHRNLRYDKSARVIAMTSLSYLFTDNLKFLIRGSFDGESSDREEKSYYGTYRDLTGRYVVGKGTAQQVNGDFLLSYNKEINNNWTVQANAGGEIRHYSNDVLTATSGPNMNVPNFFALSNTSLPTAAFDPGLNKETQSIYSNAQFGWKDAVFLEFSGRNDWSSTLPASNRSYFYPSAGASAIISDLVKLPEVFSYLKLRGSWAQVGNDASPYLLQRYATSTAGGNLGYLSLNTVLPNVELKPERTTSREVGVDLRLLNNRIGLDLTIYKTNTNNQLFTQALPVGSGAITYYTNGGDVQNKGIEAILSTTPVKSGKLTWDLNFNFALNRNLVTRLSDKSSSLVLGGDPYMRDFIVQEGQPFGQIYGKGFARDNQGNVLVSTNGLPQLTAGKTVLIGNVNPDWTGGISSSVSFKNLNASLVISHKQGGKIASFTDAILYGEGLVDETLAGRDGTLIFGQNVFTNLKAVKADGTTNNTPVSAQQLWQWVGGRAAPVGEIFAKDATNTRVREVTIGYMVPKSLFKNIPVSSMQISLVGRNLFFIYRASPSLDPDFTEGTSTVSEGYQSFAPPTTRSFGANLKINF